MVDVQKQITDMNAGWYNVVANAMDLDKTTFRLAQGTLGLQTSDNSGLFLMSDAEPPSAEVHYYDAGGLSKRSQNYQMLLSALLPETGTTLQQTLGNMYVNWIQFRDAYFKANPTATDTQLEIFQKWANSRLDPRTASTAINVFKQAANAPLNQALDAVNSSDNMMTFLDSAQQQYKLHKYSIDTGNAKAQLNTSSSVNIDFDSSKMDTTLYNTTVKGSASGFWDIFSGGASGSFEKLDQTAAGAQFTIKGVINQNATVPTQPVGWFNSAEYMRAYNNKNDATIWDPQANAGDWNSFFDPNSGSLARRVSQLVLVSDYDITVTSHASYSDSEYTQIKTGARFGIWPFFSGSVSATHTSLITHNQDGTLSVRHTLDKGKIQIWGVTVQDAPN